MATKITFQDLINKQGLTTTLEELAKKYVKQETGKQLIETTKVAKLDGIEENAQVNKVESVSFNGVDATITGKKAAITADVVSSTELDEKVGDLNYIKESDISGTYATKTEVTSGLSNKLDSSVASTTYATKEEVKAYIEAGLIYMGEVETEADLTAKEATAKKGHFYNVKSDDINRVWNGETWDKMAPIVDISGKADTATVNTELAKKANTEDVARDYALKTELPSDYLTDEDLAEYYKNGDITITVCSDDAIRALFTE